MWRLNETAEVKRQVQCLAHSQALPIFVGLLLIFQYTVPSFSYCMLQSALKKATDGSVAALHFCPSFHGSAKQINAMFPRITSFGGFSSHLSHHRALSRVPCAIQSILMSYLFYTCVCVWVSPVRRCNPVDCSHLTHSSVYTSILISQLIPSLLLTPILAFMDYLLCPAFFLSISKLSSLFRPACLDWCQGKAMICWAPVSVSWPTSQLCSTPPTHLHTLPSS